MRGLFLILTCTALFISRVSVVDAWLFFADDSTNKIQGAPSRDLTLPTSSMPFDLSVDSIQSNSISISSVGEIEGLLLGPGIDVSNMMSANLSGNFDLTGSSFAEDFNGISASRGECAVVVVAG